MTINPWTPYFKTDKLKKESKTLKKKISSLKKNMLVEIFSGGDKTLKVAIIYDLGVLGWFSFGREELTETNMWVQLRVIPSFKLPN